MSSLLEQLKFNLAPGPNYEADDGISQLSAPAPVRVIAYYLPQFHPISENDLWWGKGFTEWRNVTKAIPRFEGHLQPRLPEGLGFYDLRLTEVMTEQAALAKRHGIHGFCFYHYWFAGKRLLEAPLNMLLANPSIDLPFCICWANENWTRTWSGQENSVLIGQSYSTEGDIEFAESLKPIVSDPRYIKINGRPVVMLYRPTHLPNAQATVARWRQHFKEAGLPDPYVIMPQAYEIQDPRPFGIDAAAGFPPHNLGYNLPNIRADQVLIDPDFRGRVCDYDGMMEAAIKLDPTDYKLFHGVCPSWDNEARGPGRGTSFLGATPAKYGKWLTSACRKAMRQPDPEERIVFVNAWNEWAEGAYLEPDCHNGYAYLKETARALARAQSPDTDVDVTTAAPTREPKTSLQPGGGQSSIARATKSVRWTLRRLRWKATLLMEAATEFVRPK